MKASVVSHCCHLGSDFNFAASGVSGRTHTKCDKVIKTAPCGNGRSELSLSFPQCMELSLLAYEQKSTSEDYQVYKGSPFGTKNMYIQRASLRWFNSLSQVLEKQITLLKCRQEIALKALLVYQLQIYFF